MGKTEWKEIEYYENLGWYPLLAEMGLESFNWAGKGSWDQLIGLCEFPEKAKVIIVGCGVGTSAFLLAERYGFHVTGVDLSEKSIEVAKKTARSNDLENKTDFKIGDAHKLPFEDNSFDGVFTEYMAYFLQHGKAIPEFYRVLKVGGYVAYNELMLDPQTPPGPLAKIKYAGDLFEEVSGIKLSLPSTENYYTWSTQAGFTDIVVQKVREKIDIKEYFELAGGWKNFIQIMKLMLYLRKNSPKIKELFKKQAEVKKITMRSKKTAKYIWPAICAGKK